jgi:hypothetical protein
MPSTNGSGSIITRTLYSLAADAILVTHVLFALFVVIGLALIFAGKIASWQWVRNSLFRIAHLLGISIVVIQSWLGIICPLTIWEMNLRSKAGETIYNGSFISHWLNQLLFFQAPAWIFIACYTVFGCLVLLSWIWVRPKKFLGKESDDHR